MAGNKQDRHDAPEVRPPDVEPPEPRHEEKDVNVWAVGKFGIGLALLCIVALLLLAGLLKYFMSGETAQAPPPVGLNIDVRKLPPEPRLETAPILDLRQMRAAEDQLLTSYGWVDAQNGIVRIPIDRAIDLLAQRGLPSRPETEAPPAAAGASIPTESGLGPKMVPPGGPLAGELGEGSR